MTPLHCATQECSVSYAVDHIDLGYCCSRPVAGVAPITTISENSCREREAKDHAPDYNKAAGEAGCNHTVGEGALVEGSRYIPEVAWQYCVLVAVCRKEKENTGNG